MVRIVGSGKPVNDALPILVDFNEAFQNYGIRDRWDFKSANITRSVVSGTSRVSVISNLITGGTDLTQSVDANKPQYISGGGPNGLADAVSFAIGRGDFLNYGPFLTGTFTKAFVMRVEETGGIGVNGIIFGNSVSGNGRNTLYTRQNTPGAINVNSYIGHATVDAVAAINVPISTWFLLINTWDAASRTVRLGVRSIGQGSITWDGSSPGHTGEVGTAITQLNHTMGATGSGSDGFMGAIAGGLTFDGYNAATDAGLLAAIHAWAFGGNSIFGM